VNLVKVSFEMLDSGSECFFRTDKGVVLHARKVEVDIIEVATGRQARTGQFHEVWEIDPRGKKSRV
jgi:hypothetical protein